MVAGSVHCTAAAALIVQCYSVLSQGFCIAESCYYEDPTRGGQRGPAEPQAGHREVGPGRRQGEQGCIVYNCTVYVLELF